MKLLEDLISVLEKETLLYQEFLHLLKKERESISSFSEEHLNEIAEKNELVAALRNAEGVRGVILSGLGDEFDVKDLELTISYLIERLDEPYSSRLKNCANSLSHMVGEVSEFNRDNGVLIERSLKYINDSIRLLSGLTEERHTYSPSAAEYNQAQSGFGRVLSTEA